MLAEVDALQGRALLQPVEQAFLCQLYTHLVQPHPCVDPSSNTAIHALLLTVTLPSCGSASVCDDEQAK